jgi:hypothetical protein
MRKLKLSVESLSVQSFDTAPLVRGRGTVEGRGVLIGDYQPAYSYPECPSPLCVDTPLASCDGSCAKGCVGGNTLVND